METNLFNDDQVSVPTDPCGKNAFDNRSQSRFDFKKPRFSERNSYPRIPLSVNRSKLSIPCKSELCMLFQRGKCYFGENCHYAHNMSEIRKPGFKTAAMGEHLNEDSQRNAISRVKECYFFASGIDCPFGDKCYFLHKCDQNVSGDEGLYRKSYAINVVNGRSDGSRSDRNVCGSLNACQNYARLVNYKRKLCSKWERFGSCPYGVKCIYAHGRAEQSHFSELERDHAFRVILDSQPNNAASCEVGIKTAKELQIKGKRCFMKWDVEKISKIYADWMEMDKISVFH